MIFRRLREIHKPYLILVSLRIVLTCLPQTGYVHPDEFFQSVEVIAEKTFKVETNKPWEFNASFPVRSITPAYFTVGIGFKVLKTLDIFLWSQFDISLMTPYLMVVFPRVLFCCLSFLVDWSLYRICLANSEKYKSRCLILSTSYVMIVYATRTFSNTLELVLFSLLLYFVSESLIFSTINVRQREYIDTRYKKAKSVVERAKFHKLRLFLEDDSLRSCFAIATITAIGFFNRPTFAVYAVAPVFFWLYRGMGFKSVGSLNFYFRMSVFVACMIPTILFMVLVDSFYFGYLTWGEVGVLAVSINNFVVTPWNFIKYNMNPANLAQHGLHPRYLHAVVNVPLLFGVLGLLCYTNIVNLLSYMVQGKFHYLPTVRSIKGLMTASFVTPVVLLSVFPHQEPRFLIPLILPLVYLYGLKILPEIEDKVAKRYVTSRNTQGKVHEPRLLLKLWLTVNMLLALFYGFIHQGGVLTFVAHLSNEMRHSNRGLQYRVITSHIYSVPHSLFLQKTATFVDADIPKQLLIYEEGSRNLDRVVTKVASLLKLCHEKFSRKRCRLYLVIPTSLLDSLEYHIYKSYSNVALNNTVTFYPHLSTEALPGLSCLSSVNGCWDLLLSPASNLVKLVQSFGLARVECTLNSVRS